MSLNKIAFSDLEILSYGNHRGFPLNSGLTLLQNKFVADGYEGLFSVTEKNPFFMPVADYVAASFMNPKKSFHSFARIEEKVLRFRFALPHTNTNDPAYAIIYDAGNSDGYLACENRKTVCEILLELSGVKDGRETNSIFIELAPIDLLVILAACDIMLLNRYDAGWFTAAAVFNAYDNAGENCFRKMLFPLAYVAEDIIYRSVSYESIQSTLDKMAKAEIFDVDEIDGTILYTLALEYRYLPGLFAELKNTLAVYSYDETGSAFILFVISNQNETWGFTIKDDMGKIERLTAARLKELYANLIADDDADTSRMVQKAGKFCVNCGYSLKPESVFCPNCGQPIL